MKTKLHVTDEYVYVHISAQLSYTTQHRTVLMMLQMYAGIQRDKLAMVNVRK